MNERPKHIERYQVMTSQQRNQELKQIYDLLPDIDQNFENYAGDKFREHLSFVSDLFRRRRNSELSQDLKNRLDALLPFAKITDSFRSFILDHFCFALETGSLKGNADPNENFVWQTSDSGIFDEKEAKDIEVQAYRMMVHRHLESKYFLDKMSNKTLDGESDEQRIDSGQEFLDQWKIEFTQMHEDEP